jgi:hypothetical protein
MSLASLNYRGFLGGCHLLQLVFVKDVADMKADGVRVLLKQISHLTLSEPD